MAIICGWASKSENNSTVGKRGDQTGSEVKIGNYYFFSQDVLIRFKSIAKRKKAAKAMEALCKNENIGYSQADRTSLLAECNKIGWNIDKIDKIGLCNCDCSMLVVCAINFAYGKMLVKNSTTTTLETNTVKAFPKKFEKIKITKDTQFKLGDMPLKAGRHVIMVIKK